MADLREAVLSRLVTVCGEVPGIQAAARNRLDVPALRRPAVLINGGGEALLSSPRPAARFSEAQMMELTPQITLLVRADDGAEAGALLSLYRTRLAARVLSDDGLRQLVTTNGGIRYEGCAEPDPIPESKEARLELQIAFTMPFRLADILAEVPVVDPVRVEHPSSGAVIVLQNGEYALYVATGPLPSLTVRLPPGVPAGGPVDISFAAPVSDLVVQDSAGDSFPGGPTSGYGPGAALQFRYVDPVVGWVYWK